MTDTATSSTPDLMRRRDAVRRDYEAFKARGLRLDIHAGNRRRTSSISPTG
jgi:hypothetical protein